MKETKARKLLLSVLNISRRGKAYILNLLEKSLILKCSETWLDFFGFISRAWFILLFKLGTIKYIISSIEWYIWKNQILFSLIYSQISSKQTLEELFFKNKFLLKISCVRLNEILFPYLVSKCLHFASLFHCFFLRLSEHLEGGKSSTANQVKESFACSARSQLV